MLQLTPRSEPGEALSDDKPKETLNERISGNHFAQ
jgi:hypothetical protein